MTAPIYDFSDRVAIVTGGASGIGASSAAAPSGVVRLVTPIVVNTSIGSLPTLPAFGILDLHFIPEPGTMVLLISGLVSLAVVGRRRMGR